MKVFEIIAHPVLLISSFSLVVISGEHLGNFYLLYLLLAIPHGGIHAVVAAAGLILLLFSYLKYKRTKRYLIGPVLNIVGAICLILSLYLFFYLDETRYNEGTFEQLVPLISISLFGLCATAFVIDNLVSILNKKGNDLSMKKV